jgi:hypothetical protein
MPLTFNRNFQSAMVMVPGSTRRTRALGVLQLAGLAARRSERPGAHGEQHADRRARRQPEDRLLQVIIPAADALETVNVTTSNYDAEFGRSGGAITNVTIKSGTNQSRAAASCSATTRRPTPATTSPPKAPTKFLNSGFTLGGRSCKNKLFFFGDYQRTLDNFGYVVRGDGADGAAMRQGELHRVTHGIYDPLTGA